MKILITGGTGFLGANLAGEILTNYPDCEVVIPTTDIRQRNSFKSFGFDNKRCHLVDGDVRDYEFIRLLFNEYEFTGVYHLAAISEVRKCQDDAKLAFDVNIGGVINILEVCRLFSENIKFIIVSSSDKAYGAGDLPYKEDTKLDGKSIYEASKSSADLVARSYFYNFNLPVVVTRCSNLYGPGDMNFTRVIPNNINKILNNQSPTIWKGSEHAIREYLYISDAVEAYLSLSSNIDVAKGKAYNIGSGIKLNVEELIKMLLKEMNSKIEIQYLDKNFPEIQNQYLDSSLISSDIGWSPKISIEEGLKKTIDFYKKYFN
tara:strand:+ start:1896 stop:2849 length:954 start_codon:yes stop_codon:yes gene_type:complete